MFGPDNLIPINSPAPFTGKAIIFSAPSGSGKTTIVKHLLDTDPRLGFSISACTRDRRGRNEVHGKDYYFLSPRSSSKASTRRIRGVGRSVRGAFYGTLKSEVQRLWDSGRHVLFDVDVKGGLKLKKYFGDRPWPSS
jgi:guanylate kinase